MILHVPAGSVLLPGSGDGVVGLFVLVVVAREVDVGNCVVVGLVVVVAVVAAAVVVDTLVVSDGSEEVLSISISVVEMSSV